MVFFTRRFEEDIATELRKVASNACIWSNAEAKLLLGSMLPGSQYAESLWRMERGALFDLGPHVLAILLPVLGDVTSVRAYRERGAVTRLHLCHSDDQTSDVAVGLHSGPEQQCESYCFSGQGGNAMLTVKKDSGHSQMAFAKAISSLIESIKTGEVHPCDIHFGLRILQIILAAEKSLALGKTIKVD